MAKAAVPVSDLVRMALLNLASATGDVKLSGKGGGLFASASGANGEAIKECLNEAAPLVRVLRTEGKTQFVALAPGGFERIARELADEKVGPLAKSVATTLPLAQRIEFIQGVIGRTPVAALELTPVLEEATAAEKAETESRLEAARKRAEAEQAARAAIQRAIELLEERRRYRLEALRREYEIEGGKAADLPEPKPKSNPKPLTPPEPPRGPGPEPKTDEEKDFRRYTADRLAAAWRDAWNDGKTEGRDYVETAIWNIRGMRVIGEVGQEVPFDGRLHESDESVFSNKPVRIVRPGWLLKVDDEDYVALKAAVTKV